MRIAIYARKSTESEDRQVQSLEDQLHALRSLANRERLRVAEVFQESHSAKTPGTRPEFERLIAEIEAGRVQGVLTWSMTRLSRNPVDGGRIAYLLQIGKLDFIRTPERTYRPEDNALLLSIENGMATADIQKLSRDVKRGMLGKVERGWHAGKAPVGYKNDLETGEIVPDPVRFPLVRHGWEMMLSGGFSVAEVHRELVARGLTIASRLRPAQLISRVHTHAIFRNTFYKGSIRFRGMLYAGKHTPVVTPEEFESVQSKLRSIRDRLDRRYRTSLFPFAGIIRCARCGCSVVGEQKQKTYKGTNRVAVYTYYHCSGSKGCPKVSVSHEYLFHLFEAIGERIRVPRTTAEWLKDALLESLEGGSTATASTLASLSRSIERQDDRYKRLRSMRIDGEITGDEYMELKAEIEEKTEKLQGKYELVGREDQLILQLVYEKLDRAVEADELSGKDKDPFALGKVMSGVGKCILNLKRVEIRIDPILQKIATFEPLRNGSEKPKRGDLVSLNPIWLALVNDIRICAQKEIAIRNSEDVQV
jgi:site-specific DNA recombinase